MSKHRLNCEECDRALAEVLREYAERFRSQDLRDEFRAQKQRAFAHRGEAGAEVSPQIARLRNDIASRAWRWVWRIHGRGFSTSVGVHTRQLLSEAWAAGYRAGKRDAKR